MTSKVAAGFDKDQPKRSISTKKNEVSPAQCRAARGLLDLSQKELADAAGVSLSAVRDFEGGQRRPHRSTVAAIRRALEDAGVEFIAANGGGEGVRMRERDVE